MTDETDILFEKRGAVGLITLNRPKTLNALTRDMCLRLSDQLSLWASDEKISLVVVRGAGDRAFCAGGDIRELYESGKAGTSYVTDFYADEYRLNTQIKEYSKPFVALIDGITMGGGVGVSVHGSHRVAGDKTVFAMPETSIGLFPDVGGTYFLPRLPGALGMYLALTGARLQTADALYAGIATHYVPSDRQEALLQELSAHGDAERALHSLAIEKSPAPLADRQEKINRLFAGASLEAILMALDRENDDWCAELAKTIRRKSPTALKITHRQLREGLALDFRDCMKLEYRLTCRVMAGHDFFEGVRASVIDKDQSPQWQPARLEDVTDDDIAKYFAPLGDRELALD